METLKKSIIAVVLTIGTLTIAQAQETTRKGWDGTVKGGKTEAQSHEIKRKGWDGTVKGKQIQSTIFGEQVSDETTSNIQTAVIASRKGYQYYMAQSDMATTSSERLANNKHPDLMKRESAEVSETIQEESENKIKPTAVKDKKEYVGHVSLLK
jgi:opacity protein-like surface antigen